MESPEIKTSSWKMNSDYSTVLITLELKGIKCTLLDGTFGTKTRCVVRLGFTSCVKKCSDVHRKLLNRFIE